MQVRRTRTTPKPRRSGFTLIELLVVISIIAVLMALILPGIQQARETARRAQCLSQMRNVGMALHTYATDHGGQFPPLRGGFLINGGTTASSNLVPAPWSIHLLPNLESRALFQRIRNPSQAGPNTIENLRKTNLQVFTCPDDPDAEADGTLTFVVNAGYTTEGGWATLTDITLNAVQRNDFHGLRRNDGAGYDWSFNGYGGGTRTAGTWDLDDDDVTKGAAAFFQENASGFVGTLDNISTGDGTAQTVVISENIDATTWYSTNISDMAFVLPLAGVSRDEVADSNTQNGLGPAPGSGLPNPKGFSLAYTIPPALQNLNYSPGVAPPFSLAWINRNVGGAVAGRTPRPSSFHPGTVNVIFGDNHGTNLSETMDTRVYIDLLSSRGEANGQNILSDSDFN